MAVVGILSLQGCVEPHAVHLRKLGAEVRYVKKPQDLVGIQALVLPGGESTTMLKLAKQFDLWQPLKEARVPYWGICAGSILMAKSVENPAQESLGVMDVSVRRNAYGRQLDSFQQQLETDSGPQQAVFIRAPKFLAWGSGVTVRGRLRGDAVYLDDGRHFATAFHPELTDNSFFHEQLLARCQ